MVHFNVIYYSIIKQFTKTTKILNSKINIMRHFETRKKAKDYLKEQPSHLGLHIYKKLKGHKNRGKKPFVVGSEIEWLNLY